MYVFMCVFYCKLFTVLDIWPVYGVFNYDHLDVLLESAT